jgi:O-antigen ligase
MLPIGYYYISSREVLFQLSKIILIILAIFSVNTIISNYLQLGVSDYLEGSLYFGGGRVNITKTMVVGLISAPIYLFWEKSYIKKYIAIVIYLITFSICLVGIKRSVLLTMILGLLIFIVFGPSLLRSAKYYIFGVLIVLLTYPLYGDVFVDRFQSRQDQFAVNDEVLESEGRYLEIESVTSAIENGSWKHKLIGSEVFNDREFFDTRRMLHTDYMILLNGTGIIGFTLWLLMYLIIIKEKKRKYRQLKKTEFIKILNAVFWMLIASQFLLSISGSVYDITLRSFLFVMIGAVLGVLNNEVGNNVH